MAVAVRQEVLPPVEYAAEPIRALCTDCREPVLTVQYGESIVVAEYYEWQPRAACEHCRWPRAAHPGRPVSCHVCGGTGMVGERRPREPMLAIDVAWSDESHVRVIGVRTPRRAGEALHRLHRCHKAIMPSTRP